METEIWKDIPGYRSLYEVSNTGKVRSIRGEKTAIRKLVKNKGGYLTVILSNDGVKKTWYVHQLVAITFLDHKPCEHNAVIDHIDNDKLNNNINNLQIVNSRYNCSKDKKGYTSKYVGVFWDKSKNNWKSSIKIDGKTVNLGHFKTELDAHKAYQEELNKLT